MSEERPPGPRECAGGLRVDLGGGACWFGTEAAGDFTDPTAVQLEALGRALGIQGRAFARSSQVHGSSIRVVSGPSEAVQGAGHDGQLTGSTEVVCAVRVADCLPVAIASPGAAGVLHAGWRGLAAGVIEAGVKALEAIAPGRVTAAIGPGARACCYEAGPEVHAAFAGLGRSARKGGMADLPWIATEKLRAVGVEDVLDCGICTICSVEPRWHSYRRDHEEAGRSLALAWRN